MENLRYDIFLISYIDGIFLREMKMILLSGLDRCPTNYEPHRSSDEILAAINKILGSIELALPPYINYAKLNRCRKLAQHLSVKNEQCMISIPLAAILSLITRLIIFKVAVIFKIFNLKILEANAQREMAQKGHFILPALSKLSASKEAMEKVCLA